MRIALALCLLPRLAAADAVAVTARTREPVQSWFTIGATTTPDASAYGVRLQSDWLAGTAWSGGLFLSVLQRGEQVMGVGVPQASGGLFVAHSNAIAGPVWLRGQLGVGGAISAHATESSVIAGGSVTSTSLVGEAALFVSVDMGDRFALVGGPIVQVADTPAPGYGTNTLTVFVGLQHR
jgi:hypothetical protein